MGGGDLILGGGEKTRCGDGRTGDGEIGRDEDIAYFLYNNVLKFPFSKFPVPRSLRRRDAPDFGMNSGPTGEITIPDE
jgi:hypothetical protein